MSKKKDSSKDELLKIKGTLDDVLRKAVEPSPHSRKPMTQEDVDWVLKRTREIALEKKAEQEARERGELDEEE